MYDPLRDRVVKAVEQADRDHPAATFGVADHATPEPQRFLELADLDMILGRHRRLAQDTGYRMGLANGRLQGATEQTALLSRRVEAAATQLIARLNTVINEASTALGQDHVKRARMRQQVEEALVGVVSVRGILSELAPLVVDA